MPFGLLLLLLRVQCAPRTSTEVEASMANPEVLFLVLVGADSRFFALLGSAPQELNAVRPEAKLTC
jgi:hypothetical protein